ncbi:outer membrane protein assembly factor [Aquimarina sp. ERC-38]|uniref:translocation and assembly module lipoprotein TamL n=1 Tax=Aquimarina sp. ERC-38 TaxID=2949996 RepID=UPI002246B4F9|nr:BamA/TamA family outer membrane protein [Aquimarina sp. ERC-38]UZO82469.1 outer membrane protein assembly factor [Aquimarina sp. ERC-38]
MTRKKVKIYVFIFLSQILILSCGVEKFIPEDEVLYTGATLDIKANDTIRDLKEVKGEVLQVIRPNPNTKILGMRLGLYYHYKAQKEKPGFIVKFLNKKLGEEPVYLSGIDVEASEKLIENRFENRGFFENRIDADIHEKEKTASITYTAEIEAPYRLQTYQLDSFPSPMNKVIQNTMDKTILKKGNRFDLALFKQERQRIDDYLKNKGYYNFNSDFLIFEADTNQYKNKRFDLYLRLKKEVPKKSIVPYTLEEINVYPKYSLETEEKVKDTVVLDSINYIQDSLFFKPKRLEPYLLLDKGQRYNPRASSLTSKRLSGIGTYKFINIQYEEMDTINDGVTPKKLRTSIYLSPLTKRSVRAELQAVSKSNNFAGPTLLARFSNRNLFKGGETLNLTSTLGYETQLGGSGNRGLSSLQLSLSGDLIFPRLLFPIKIDKPFEYAIPSTKISLGGELLDRSRLYRLTSLNAIFGYEWNANRFVFHGLNPISINYLNLTNTTDDFQEILDENAFLQSSFDQQFIAGFTYTFIYNEIEKEGIKNGFFTKVNLDVAGNLVDLIASGSSENENVARTFLGLQYAQYFKIDTDIRYHLNFKNEHQLVSRVFAGIGKPYGNSKTLPFIKQFFSGGPYSVRAFRIRSLGPGAYQPEDQNSDRNFFDRSGDIRLEANLEYRFPLFPFVYGAVFVDAGNVWLLDENVEFDTDSNPGRRNNFEGGQFSSDFLNQLGIGAGVGLRVDIQNFVIRFDLAAPLQDPASEGDGSSFNFNLDQPVLNFAIGYPF